MDSVNEDRVQLAALLPGATVHPLDEGESAVEAFLLIKVRDSDGGLSWSYRTTQVPNREELLGALTTQVDLLRRELLEEWTTG